MGLVYPAVMTRGEIRAAVAAAEAKEQRGRAIRTGHRYIPAASRGFTPDEQGALLASGRPYAWRLDMGEALRRAAGHSPGEKRIEPIGRSPIGRKRLDRRRSGRLG